MARLIRKLFNFALFAGVMLTPNLVFAQSFSIFNEATSCKGGVMTITGETTSSQWCTLCDLLVVIQNSVNYILLLLIPIAALVVIVGGYFILTAGGKPDNVKRGRTAILSAVVGIAIAFGSWIIVNEVMSFLVAGKPTAAFWYTITCQQGVAPTAPTPTPTPTPPPPTALKCSAGSASAETGQLVNCVQGRVASAGLSLGGITTNGGCHTCVVPQGSTLQGGCSNQSFGSPTNISCHYGGTNCNGVGHAADFPLSSPRNQANWDKLKSIVLSCGATGAWCEGTQVVNGSTRYSDCSNSSINHVHANDASSGSCGCN